MGVIFYFLMCICFVESLKLKNLPLVSRKLCNNDPDDILSQKCYTSDYNSEVPCDSRKISKENCNHLIVNIEEILTLSVINHVGSLIDQDKTIRRLTINLAVKLSNLTTLGNMTDQLILTRPMWSVVQEPYNFTDSPIIILERYNQLWDPYFENRVELQFPSAKVCESSLLIVGRYGCVHPGYSDVRRDYFSWNRVTPAIFTVYVPFEENPFNRTGFISSNDCPEDHKNRWTCAFLPMTNCTLPKAVEKYDYDPPDRPELYSKAAIDGVALNVHENFEHHIIDKMGSKNEHYSLRSKHNAIVLNNLPTYVYTSPFSHVKNMFRFHGPEGNQVADFLHMEFLYRKTFFYRSQVAKSLGQFRAKYGFGDSIRTNERRFVAVHLRRTDRVLPNANMTEICRLIWIQKITGVQQNCTVNGEIRPCLSREDVYGCVNQGDVPIGAITLPDVIKEAELLIGPSIRNMIVFSDDILWLSEQIEVVNEMKTDWKFYTLDPPNIETEEDRHYTYDHKLMYNI